MMGQQPPGGNELFYYGFSLEDRVRADHPLRRVAELVDFEFVVSEVKGTYGHNGNVSVPPVVIIKLMFLLFYYNVRSERELMATVPERLDWLWFLGYSLNSTVPHHSVLSKARARWGEGLFASFFERIVAQCVERGLVAGGTVFVDSSIVDADASKDSLVKIDDLKSQLRSDYAELVSRLEERSERAGPRSRGRTSNRRLVSSTDPDATLVRKGRQHLGYQVHRGVDGDKEVITATMTTTGDVNEGHYLEDVIEAAESNTGTAVSAVAADRKYGTADNYLKAHDAGRAAHIPAMKDTSDASRFRRSAFVYDAEADSYRCPAGHELKRAGSNRKRKVLYYQCRAAVCNACPLKSRCTRSTRGRRLTCHERQGELDQMRAASVSAASRADGKTRFHLMERSFARSKRYGYDRCRWRGLGRARIQEYLVCAVQNISILIQNADRFIARGHQMAEVRLSTLWNRILGKPDYETAPLLAL
jgi:transposase